MKKITSLFLLMIILCNSVNIIAADSERKDVFVDGVRYEQEGDFLYIPQRDIVYMYVGDEEYIDSVYSEGERFELKGDYLYYPDTNQIYLYVGKDKDITIPENSDITRMNHGVQKKYNSVTIEDNVKFDVFPLRPNEVIFKEGITSIPAGAFEDSSVKKVVFPNSLKEIGDVAFSGSELSGKLILPDGVVSIGKEAFKETKITEVVMGDNVKSIGNGAFKYCEKLKSVRLSDNIEKWEKDIFSGVSLKKVNLPKKLNIKASGDVLFGGKNWEECELELNRDMTIEVFDFVGKFSCWEKYCKPEKLKKYKDGEDWCVIDDILVGYTGKSSKPVIPDFVREVYSDIFGPQANRMETVIIPSSVKKLCERAFVGAPMEYLTVPETVEEIGGHFIANTQIKELTIEGTPKIDAMALSSCHFLLKSKLHINPECKLPSDLNMDELAADEWWLNDPEYMDTLNKTPKPTAVPVSTDKPAEKPTDTSSPETTPQPLTLTVKGGEELSISVNGEPVSFPDEKPFVDSNGRTQVPIRAVSELLKCRVDWLDEVKTAVITKESGDTVKITIDSDVIEVNEKTVKMDTKAIIRNDRTFIPVRFAAEALGMTVNWAEH